MKVDKGMDHRGIWRAVYTSIWDDPEFRKFTVKEKLVFFNLRTGPQSNLPGIFLYYVQPINEQTGVGMKSIRAALHTLSDKNWIEIEGGILWIKKALRFDPNIALTNPKHLTAITNIILSLPKRQIVRDFIDYYKIPIAYPIPSRLAYNIPYTNQKTDTEKEKEEDTKEEEESEEKPKVKPLSLSSKENPKTEPTKEIVGSLVKEIPDPAKEREVRFEAKREELHRQAKELGIIEGS